MLQRAKVPISLLVHDARNAFFDMKAEIVDKLAKKELEIVFEAGMDFPNRLLANIKRILHCTDGEDLKILEQRTFKRNLVSGI